MVPPPPRLTATTPADPTAGDRVVEVKDSRSSPCRAHLDPRGGLGQRHLQRLVHLDGSRRLPLGGQLRRRQPQHAARLGHNTACNDTSEDLTVTSVASSLTSAQTWVPSTAPVTAPRRRRAAGSVLFEFFTNGTCDGTAAHNPHGCRVRPRASPARAMPRADRERLVRGGSATTAQPPVQDIGAKRHETSALTISNGGTVTSNP